MGEYEIINEMLNRYNSGAITLDEQQKEMLAMQAHRLGLQFDVESQPFKKGLFDAADMALFGMLPNKWRPVSAGQELYGETGIDKFAGGVGSVAGLGTGIYGAVKGAGKLAGMYKQSGGIKAAVARAKESEAAARAAGLASSVYNRGANVVAPAIKTASAGIGRAAGRVRQGVGSAAGRVGQRFPGAQATTADALAAIRNRTRIMPEIGPFKRSDWAGMFQKGGMVGYQEGGHIDDSAYFMNLVEKAREKASRPGYYSYQEGDAARFLDPHYRTMRPPTEENFVPRTVKERIPDPTDMHMDFREDIQNINERSGF